MFGGSAATLVILALTTAIIDGKPAEPDGQVARCDTVRAESKLEAVGAAPAEDAGVSFEPETAAPCKPRLAAF